MNSIHLQQDFQDVWVGSGYLHFIDKSYGSWNLRCASASFGLPKLHSSCAVASEVKYTSECDFT